MWIPDLCRGLIAFLGIGLLAGCTAPATTGTRDYDGGSRLRVAAAAENSGQFDVALSLYASAAAAEPGRADIQARFAAALARSGNIAQADQVLAKASERQPDDPVLLLQLGRLRLRTGAAEEALAIFGRLLAVAPRQAEAWDLQGVSLDLLGRQAEAERSYRRALALAPDDIATANNLALSLLLAGKAPEALAMLEVLASRAATQPRVAANLAIARAAVGHPAQAPASGVPGSDGDDLRAIVHSLAADVSGIARPGS